jgi:hypothetical protein
MVLFPRMRARAILAIVRGSACLLRDPSGMKSLLSPSILARHLAHQGDEHAFSLLYLAAGAFCLYAAYGHGDSALDARIPR